MDDRKVYATRVRTMPLVLGVALCLEFPARIQAQCSQLRHNMTDSYSESCPFPNYGVNKSESWDINIDMSCESGGWRTSRGDSGSLQAQASGNCAYAENNEPPICEGEIFGPINGGTANGQMRVYLDVHDLAWNGTSCYVSGSGQVDAYLTDEGCQSGFCCNLEAECIRNGEWYGDTCTCVFSPVLIDLDGNGFNLTDAQGGVNFDLDRNGTAERIAWTSRDGNDAFLVLDRNNNDRIDDGSELFGSTTDQPRTASPNGFNALAVFDSDRDGKITPRDAIFNSLRLWVDSNHDGVSQEGELLRLDEVGIEAISLDYKRARRQDAHGNIFRYRAKVETAKRSRVGPNAVDVFLMALP